MIIPIPKGIGLADLEATYGVTREQLQEANRNADLDNLGGRYIDLPIETGVPTFRSPSLDQGVKEYGDILGDMEEDLAKSDTEMRREDLTSYSLEPTEQFLSHLKDREGYREEVYLDSLGKPTVGVGHYDPAMKVGEKYSTEQLDAFLREDSMKAYVAAVKQAESLGRTDQEFINGLASVNFQLGTAWPEIHKRTWKLMTEGRWEEAAEEAANSKWNAQTPTRVRDFQTVLRNG